MMTFIGRLRSGLMSVDDLESYLRSIGLTCDHYRPNCTVAYRKENRGYEFVEILYEPDGACTVEYYREFPGRCAISFDADYASLGETRDAIVEWFSDH